MLYKTSDELCKMISDKTDGICQLAFSLGKDSIASWLKLKEHFHTIIPVYYYSVPNLSFINKSIRYYEDFFETRIIQVPQPSLYKQLRAGVFQTKESWAAIKKFNLPLFKREEIHEWVAEDLGLPTNAYTAVGNRAADNLTRQVAIVKRDKTTREIIEYKAHNDRLKKFFPVFDFDIKMVVDIIRKSGIKLPEDYHIWGKTFDGKDYRFVEPLKKHYPEDYEIIKSYFPLIDNEIIRNEYL